MTFCLNLTIRYNVYDITRCLVSFNLLMRHFVWCVFGTSTVYLCLPIGLWKVFRPYRHSSVSAQRCATCWRRKNRCAACNWHRYDNSATHSPNSWNLISFFSFFLYFFAFARFVVGVCVCTQVCEHCSYRNAKEYQWQNKTIILAADYASNGIYNFIIPLRAHFKSKTSLNPIILLLETRPKVDFLDAISYFPLVYWMLGSIDCLDDLLRGGITLAENVVVVNKEQSNSAEEDSLADCNTIVAVQNMFK